MIIIITNVYIFLNNTVKDMLTMEALQYKGQFYVIIFPKGLNFVPNLFGIVVK